MFKKLNYTEPAILRAIVAALIALAGSIGFTVNADLSNGAETLIVGFSTIYPVLQGVITRMGVWSPKGKDEAVASARGAGPQQPGVADHARY